MIAKKRKRFLFVLMIGLLISALLAVGLVRIYKVRRFSLEDYSEFLNAPTWYEESHLGKLGSASEARKAAIKVFRNVYADDFSAQTFPYIVSYDSENDVWLVQSGKYFIPKWGAHIIIDASDGEILGLWNYKF